jgi:hypothetical protein
MPIAKDKKQINVLLNIEDADTLRALANKQERSVSQMAAILIREGLERAGLKIVSTSEEDAA